MFTGFTVDLQLLQGPEPHLPPLSESHGFNEPHFDACDRLQFVLEERQNDAPDSSSRTIDLESSPCRVAFWKERDFPSGVTGPVDFAELAEDAFLPSSLIGPRDFAPLARELSILSEELISWRLWQGRRVVPGAF